MELRIPTLEQLRTVYDRDLRASFPAAELKPLRNIEEMWAGGQYRPWCLFDGDDIAGEAFLWLGHPGWALLDYLCVASDRRNGGLGSVILEKLREAEGDTVIFGESEIPDYAPDPAMAERRLGFYARSGARTAGYDTEMFGVPYKTLYWAAGDVDEAALSYAEVKMLATGNPYIKEKMDLDIAVSRLRLLQSDYLSRKYELEDKVAKHYPVMIEHTKETVRGLKADMDLLRQHQSEDFPGMEIEGVLFKERAAAGAAIVELCKRAKDSNEREIGTYKGFKMLLSFDTFDRHFKLNCKGTMSHVTELGADALGNMTRIENTLKGVADRAEANEEKLQELRRQMENAKEEIGRPFKQEQELKEKTERLTAVNALLNLGDATPEAVDTTPEETQEKTQEIQR